MFNGIIYNQGTIFKLERKKNSLNITLKTNLRFNKSEIGESISCNGACLTLTGIKNSYISFYLSKETLDKTNFKYSKIGQTLNIERSLSYGKKISGHYIQGHVDTTSHVSKIVLKDKTWIVSFFLSKSFKKYVIEKGSIGINGVSLTVSKITKNNFEVNIIPHTLKLTNLFKLKKKDLVNIEFDIFSKYLVKLKN
jgi:riboflavin synthase